MSNINAKKLGFWSIVLLTINSIIGSGIFISPGSVIAQAGDKSIIIYLCAAVFAIVLAITFASAAKYVSKGGAAYAYAKAAFGDNVGFYVGITRFIAASIAWGVMAVAVVRTVLKIFNIKADFNTITISFILLMAVLVIINIFGVKCLEIISNLSTIGKLIALITVIVAGFIVVLMTGENHIHEASTIISAETGKNIVPQFNTSVLVVSTIAAFYAFTGFESIASGSEDMKDPEKNLPIAIPLGIIIIAAIYIGIIFIILFLNPSDVVNEKTGVGLIHVFKNPILKNIVLYGALVSMFGINVAASFHTPRILESISKEKQIPAIFSVRSKSNFPVYSFAITAVLAIIVPMSFKYDMTSITIISSISRFVQFLIVPIGVILFFMGKHKGEIHENAKKNFITDVIFPAFSFIFSLFLLIKFNWKGQFTLSNGELNSFAIISMLVGYILLPLILFVTKNRYKDK